MEDCELLDREIGRKRRGLGSVAWRKRLSGIAKEKASKREWSKSLPAGRLVELFVSCSYRTPAGLDEEHMNSGALSIYTDILREGTNIALTKWRI